MAENKPNIWVWGFAASQFGFLAVGGLLLGLWLDRRWNTIPLLGLLGLALGFAAGIRVLLRMTKSAKESKPNV